MGDRNPTTDWPWLVSGAMFEAMNSLLRAEGFTSLLEAEKFGRLTESQLRALRHLRNDVGAIRALSEALAGLASLEGAWPKVELARTPLRELLTEVASLPLLVGRPVDVRVADEDAEVVAASPVLERALAGLARIVVSEGWDSPRPTQYLGGRSAVGT